MSELYSESRASYWHDLVGDVALWYPTFMAYAAAAPNSGELHGPHTAEPVGLDRVMDGLDWLAVSHAEQLAKNPLPTVDEMRAALDTRNAITGIEPRDDGSPMHNFWHWCHGS